MKTALRPLEVRLKTAWGLVQDNSREMRIEIEISLNWINIERITILELKTSSRLLVNLRGSKNTKIPLCPRAQSWCVTWPGISWWRTGCTHYRWRAGAAPGPGRSPAAGHSGSCQPGQRWVRIFGYRTKFELVFLENVSRNCTISSKQSG